MKKGMVLLFILVAVLLVMIGTEMQMRNGLIWPSRLDTMDRRTSEDADGKIGGTFTLVDHTGQVVTQADFSGRYMLVYFGYTFCPDICPTALQTMMNAYKQLSPEWQKRIAPLFITVDPERDTIEKMRGYVTTLHPALIGLTGTLEQITATAKTYKVYFAKVQSEDDGSRSYYLVDHSSIIYLMDPQGRYHAHFGHGISVDALLIKLKSLSWAME